MIQEFNVDLKKQCIIIMGLPAAGKSYFIDHDLKKYFNISSGYTIRNTDNILRKSQYDLATQHFNWLQSNIKSTSDRNDLAKVFFKFKNDTKYVNRSGVTIIHPITISWWLNNDHNLKSFFNSFYKSFYASYFILRDVAKQYADELFSTKIYQSSNLVIIDTTSNANKMINKIKEIKEQDFMVSVLYLSIDLDLAIKRDTHRGKVSGRRVGDDIISQYNTSIKNSIEQYKKLAKTDKLIDRILIFEYEYKSGLFNGKYKLISDVYYTLNIDQPYNKIKKSIKNEIVSFLHEQTTPRTIYVDLDGVLVDFERQLHDKTGIDDFKTFEQQHGENLIWDKIKEHGVEFWSEMPWLDGGKELWNYIKKYNPIILSAPSKDKNSKIGKIQWIKKHLGDVPYILVPAKEKQNYSDSNSILIDDYVRNIQQWHNKGGIAIHHENLNDTLNQLKRLGV